MNPVIHVGQKSSFVFPPWNVYNIYCNHDILKQKGISD